MSAFLHTGDPSSSPVGELIIQYTASYESSSFLPPVTIPVFHIVIAFFMQRNPVIFKSSLLCFLQDSPLAELQLMGMYYFVTIFIEFNRSIFYQIGNEI